MTIPEALKALYAAIGGTAADVADLSTTAEVLNAFSVYLEGDGGATKNVDAIMNIVAVAGNLIPDPTLIDKNITANGTYNAADDEADGYKKVVVNVSSNQKTEFFDNPNENHAFYINANSIKKLSVPEGIKNIIASTSDNSVAKAAYMTEIEIPSTVETLTGNMFNGCTSLEKIVINKPEGSITGAPWGAPQTCEIVWLG